MAEKKPTPPKSRSRSKSVKSNSIITPIILFAVAVFLEALALIPQKDVAVWNFYITLFSHFSGFALLFGRYFWDMRRCKCHAISTRKREEIRLL